MFTDQETAYRLAEPTFILVALVRSQVQAQVHQNVYGRALLSRTLNCEKPVAQKFKNLTISRAQMGESTVYDRWGLRHPNFVFMCCMATRLRMKLPIDLPYQLTKSFWGVHVQDLAGFFFFFCSKVGSFSLSQRVVTELSQKGCWGSLGVPSLSWRKWTACRRWTDLWRQ